MLRKILSLAKAAVARVLDRPLIEPDPTIPAEVKSIYDDPDALWALYELERKAYYLRHPLMQGSKTRARERRMNQPAMWHARRHDASLSSGVKA